MANEASCPFEGNRRRAQHQRCDINPVVGLSRLGPGLCGCGDAGASHLFGRYESPPRTVRNRRPRGRCWGQCDACLIGQDQEHALMCHMVMGVPPLLMEGELAPAHGRCMLVLLPFICSHPPHVSTFFPICRHATLNCHIRITTQPLTGPFGFQDAGSEEILWHAGRHP